MRYWGATIVTFVLAMALGTHTIEQAQPVTISMFENVRLNSNYIPEPIIVRGISGGSVLAKKIAGKNETSNGACAGFVDARPDHTLVLETFFDYLSLQVHSPQDTTIVVRGPGGSWCNDDAQGKNPGLAGEWLAGTYRIWVGSYDQTKYHPYLLRISKQKS